MGFLSKGPPFGESRKTREDLSRNEEEEEEEEVVALRCNRTTSLASSRSGGESSSSLSRETVGSLFMIDGDR